MKTEGIVRKFDDLGRITIPIEIRNSNGISSKDPFKIIPTNKGILLVPYEEDEFSNLYKRIKALYQQDKEAVIKALDQLESNMKAGEYYVER